MWTVSSTIERKKKENISCYILLHTVDAPINVKKVINPSKEQVEELHAHYVEKLKELFKEHRDTYGVPKTTELILE